MTKGHPWVVEQNPPGHGLWCVYVVFEARGFIIRYVLINSWKAEDAVKLPSLSALAVQYAIARGASMMPSDGTQYCCPWRERHVGEFLLFVRLSCTRFMSRQVVEARVIVAAFFSAQCASQQWFV